MEAANEAVEDGAPPRPESDSTPISSRMWASSLISAFPSFLFGYCMSALNTALATGEDSSSNSCFNGADSTCPQGSALRDIDLPTGLQEVATSLLIAGAWLGSMLASKPSDALGRRRTLLINNALFICGGTLCATATQSSHLLIGRFISGVGVGCGSGVVPVLLSEISSPRNRGAVGSIHQLMINLGILSSGVLGYALVQDVAHGWRYMQAFITVPAIAQVLLAGFVPESPRWLVKHGRVAEAKALLRNLRGVGVNGLGQAEIEREVDGMEGSKYEQQKGSASWRDLWAYRRQVTIGVTLMMLQAVTGINTVVFYSTTIFELAGVNDEVLATVAVGLSLVVMTCVSGSLVDKAGRRSLLLVGTIIMGLALSSLSFILFALNASPLIQGWLAVCATLFFIAGFSLGMGAVAWIFLAEIVPSRIRARAFSVFTAVNWASNLLIGLYTLTAIDMMGRWLLPSTPGPWSHDDDDDSAKNQQKAGVAGLYALFALACVGAVAFIFVFVRETMRKSLEELEDKGRGGATAGDVGLAERQELGGGEGFVDGAGDALLQEEHRHGEEYEQVDEVHRVAL